MARLRRDESGAILLVTGLLVTVLVGFTGIGTDVGIWYATQRKAQNAADSAAIAGAFELLSAGWTTSQVTAAAKGDAALNGFVDGSGATVSVAVDGTDWTVDVTVATPAPLFFASLFLSEEPTITTQAVAGYPNPPLCMLALESSAADAVRVEGTSRLEASGCLVHDNSSNNGAMATTGGGRITAEKICVVGRATGSGYSPAATQGCPSRSDPLAGLTPPAYSGCNYTRTGAADDITTDRTFTNTGSPVVFCNGLTVKSARVTLQPGVYVVKNGQLNITSSAQIVGSGVMIFLTGPNANVLMDGTSSVDLSAPTSGPYKGILFYQGPGAAAGLTSTLTGDGLSHYAGALYFPGQHLEVRGSAAATGTTQHTAVIARSMLFTGGGKLTLRAALPGSGPAADALVPRPVLMI